jgi:hypothetical protein
VEAQGTPNTTEAHRNLLESPPPIWKTRCTIGHLRVVTEPVQSSGNLHNLIGGSQESPLRHHKAWEVLHNLIGVPQVIATKAPQSLGRYSQLNWRSSSNPLNRLGFQEPKSKKLNELSPPNLRGELKAMQPIQWQEHKCSNPRPRLAPPPPQRLQDQDSGAVLPPTPSPHPHSSKPSLPHILHIRSIALRNWLRGVHEDNILACVTLSE